MAIKVMLIEDEPGIRLLLKKIIEKQEDFCVVGEAETFAQAVTMFTSTRPEVVFVDIDLGGESGFDLAKVMTEIDPKLKVVFATAHSEYMAGAFEIYAFDYIVKPFDIERVQRTLTRIRESAPVAAQPAAVTDDNGRLMIKGREQVSFVDKDEIIFIERCEGTTEITTAAEVYRTSVSLTDLEEKLTEKFFMRSHKSYIINTQSITKIEPYGRWTYVVRFKGTDKTALITAQKYEELREFYS